MITPRRLLYRIDRTVKGSSEHNIITGPIFQLSLTFPLFVYLLVTFETGSPCVTLPGCVSLCITGAWYVRVSAGGRALLHMWRSEDNLWPWSSLSTFRQGLLFVAVYTRLAGLQGFGNFHVFVSHLSIQTEITDWYNSARAYVGSEDSNSHFHVTYGAITTVSC